MNGLLGSRPRRARAFGGELVKPSRLGERRKHDAQACVSFALASNARRATWDALTHRLALPWPAPLEDESMERVEGSAGAAPDDRRTELGCGSREAPVRETRLELARLDLELGERSRAVDVPRREVDLDVPEELALPELDHRALEHERECRVRAATPAEATKAAAQEQSTAHCKEEAPWADRRPILHPLRDARRVALHRFREEEIAALELPTERRISFCEERPADIQGGTSGRLDCLLDLGEVVAASLLPMGREERMRFGLIGPFARRTRPYFLRQRNRDCARQLGQRGLEFVVEPPRAQQNGTFLAGPTRLPCAGNPVIRAGKRLVALLSTPRLEPSTDAVAPREQVAAHDILDRLPRGRLSRAVIEGPLDRQVKGLVPPEQRVRTVLPDDGHDAEAFEEIAERTR